MDHPTQFLIAHGLVLLFAAVFIEQIGLPIPCAPWLLAAGALAAQGQLNLFAGLAATLLACLIADAVWFYLGRYGGSRVLQFLCRVSLEPDSCVRRTENIFERHGMRTVVAAKFLPGLGTVIPPLAGAFGIPLGKFLAYDALGSLLYGGVFLGLGYAFSEQLGRVGGALAQLGGWAIVLLCGLVGLYIAYKFIERQRVLHRLRIARVTPEEVFQKLSAGEELVILDLRSAAELKLDATRIRGAICMNVAEVELRHGEIPRDRDVIVYCSCPNEVTAARVALLLQRQGITRVRPLLGGIRAWRELKYPVEDSAPGVEALAH